MLKNNDIFTFTRRPFFLVMTTVPVLLCIFIIYEKDKMP